MADSPLRRSLPEIDNIGRERVDELILGVNMALGNTTLDQCEAFDCNGDGHVSVDCLVRAVRTALFGMCPCFDAGCR